MALVPAGAAQARIPAVEAVPTMIVLDASGSMKTDDAPGSRMDAAKAAVTTLISRLPAGAPVGLQVYGTATGSSDAEKTAGCADVKTLTPVGPLDVEAMTAAVNGIQASGYTPIGAALKSAADGLPNEGPRSIVLVSDGEDTCAPPTPCEVAKELKQTGVDLVVHTVGFKVDQTARDQLACIAQSTGGSYSDATDATQLDSVLTRQVQNALTGYNAQGTPVVGLDALDPQAPLLAPGQYTDVLALGENDSRIGSSKHYRIPMYPGAQPYISVTTVLPPGEDVESYQLVGTKVELIDIDGDLCQQSSATSQVGYGRYRTPTSVLSWSAPNSDCADREWLYVRVERIGPAYTDEELTVEIAVRIEPPADASGLPDAADKGPDLPAPVFGTPSPIAGGTSFNDAPILANAATYSDTLATGESRYYRVALTWGQRLTYFVQHTGPAAPLQTNGSPVDIRLFNPVREDVGTGNSAQMFDKRRQFVVSSTDYPVRYNNRDNSSKQNLSLDGEYFLVLTAARPDGNNVDSTTTVTFTTVTSGDVDPAPAYQPPGGAAGQISPSVAGQSDEIGSTPDGAGETELSDTADAGNTESGTSEPGTSEPGTSDSGTSDSGTSTVSTSSSSNVGAPELSADSEGSDPLNILWWMSGSLLLLAIVGGGLALRRSRSASAKRHADTGPGVGQGPHWG